MSNADAIRPGTSLSRYARELTRLHDAVVSGAPAATQPRAVVARSWQRAMRAGLDPSRKNPREPVSLDEVLRRREASRLGPIVDDLIQAITGVSGTSHLLLVITDVDGIVLWRAGSSTLRSTADRLGFAVGAEWSEAQVGTNAIGTALAEATPVQLFSAEHFEQAQHGWYCSAAPIHDPRTGELLAVIDVSGPALTLHPAIAPLVHTAVRLAETQLWRNHEARLARLRRSAEHLLSTVQGPVLLVDDHGWVAHHAGVAAPERVAVPRERSTLAIPGLGICLPERLSDGWLVRPAAGRLSIRARLELSGSPILEVRSADDAWRSPLSLRHAEILQLLLAAGPKGLTSGQLSGALFGDGDHAVTVRAEISRMRRHIGALVATRPYRIADGVRLEMANP